VRLHDVGDGIRRLRRRRGGALSRALHRRHAQVRRESEARKFIVATETEMLHPLREQNPGKRFIPVSRMAVCRYMKMITLPKLRDALRNLAPEVRVPPEIAERARVPIERMVAIS